eukprot:scaffold182918_cov15-Tisochrysis_lutea.AAC.1
MLTAPQPINLSDSDEDEPEPDSRLEIPANKVSLLCGGALEFNSEMALTTAGINPCVSLHYTPGSSDMFDPWHGEWALQQQLKITKAAIRIGLVLECLLLLLLLNPLVVSFDLKPFTDNITKRQGDDQGECQERTPQTHIGWLSCAPICHRVPNALVSNQVLHTACKTSLYFAGQVKYVVGPGGSNIQNIQRKSKARIQVQKVRESGACTKFIHSP